MRKSITFELIYVIEYTGSDLNRGQNNVYQVGLILFTRGQSINNLNFEGENVSLLNKYLHKTVLRF